MPAWQWLLDGAGVLLLCAIFYGVGLVVRRWLLARRVGSFEVSHRVRSDHPGRGWLLGLGRYAGENFEWFRVFSLAWRPKRTWRRFDLEYAGRRDPVGPESVSLYSGHVIVLCTTSDGEVEFAMSPASLMGFQAWLEAMPPGSRGVRPGDPPTSM